MPRSWWEHADSAETGQTDRRRHCLLLVATGAAAETYSTSHSNHGMKNCVRLATGRQAEARSPRRNVTEQVFLSCRTAADRV